jgi:dihydroorotate dehydrogenase (NAD+) catalytic subunit
MSVLMGRSLPERWCLVNNPFAGLSFCGVPFKNPIITAAGTFNYGREYSRYFDLNVLGGIVTKGTSLLPIAGNPTPRVAETPSGMLNAIGLENKGVDYYVAHDLPWLRQHTDSVIIVNVFGNSASEFAAVAAKLGDLPHFLELNLSCPNVHGGQLPFAADPAAVFEVVSRVKAATNLPVIVKLSPNSDPLPAAEAATRAGADAFSLINTLIGMRIDLSTRRPVLANQTGGLSGPAIFPVALRLVHQLYRHTKLPIIGLGGVSNAEQALEMALAGATLVGVGTAIYQNPLALVEITTQLEQYLSERQQHWSDWVGGAH